MLEKKELIEKFSLLNWNKLNTISKSLHTLHDCQPCKELVFKTSNTQPAINLPVPFPSTNSISSCPIANILPVTPVTISMADEVKSFDSHHQLFKDFRYEQSANICHNIKSNLKIKLNNVYQSAKESLEEWENKFFESNGREPLSADITGDVKHLFDQVKHSKSIIKLWNIK